MAIQVDRFEFYFAQFSANLLRLLPFGSFKETPEI
jgi:hypothetical protein